MPKFTLNEGQLATIQDKWLYFVKNAGRLSVVPQALDEEPIREAFAIANTAALSSAELEQQERRHDFIRLQRGAQEKAFEDGQALGEVKGLALGEAKGRALGEAKGRAEGEQAKALAVAQNLLPVLDDAAIAAATGLDLAAVAQLRTAFLISNSYF